MRTGLVFLAVVALHAVPARSDEGPGGCSPLAALDPANRLVLEGVCADGPGFLEQDPPECALLALGSTLDLLTQAFEVPTEQRKTIATVGAGFANALTGSNALSTLVVETLAGVAAPTLTLNVDPCDALLSDRAGGCAGPAPAPHPTFASLGPTLNGTASDEQEALLGCGPLLGGDCEASGIDPFTADPAVLTQSWVGFDGTCIRQDGFEEWHLANGAPQAGTMGHPGAAAFDVAGARSPFLADGTTPNPAHEPSVDGSTAGLVIPGEFGASAGQPFASEMAAVSFNLQLVLVALSAAEGPPARDQLDPSRPYAFYDPAEPGTLADRGRCSFAQPQHCRVVRAIVVPAPGATLGAAVSALALATLASRRRRLARSDARRSR